MSIQKVCRLCLSKDNLVWVFDERLERSDHIKDVILITTGVEIHSKDIISQMICTKCCLAAIKMFQFRQESLKNDRYLKAQCRNLLKHTELKIPNTNVTIKTEMIDKEEKKHDPCKPLYRVHPTMRALSRKYPQLQFPSICLLSNVDPCISMEMDVVENYFKSRNLNMRKYVQVALRAGGSPKKSPMITKSSETITEYSANNKITDHVAHNTSAAISKTVGSAEIVHKVSPINIKLNQSGYSIVRPSTENVNHSRVKNICETTSLCEQLTTDSPESQSVISESKKRRHSGNDFLSEPQTKKVPNANPSNTTPVQPSVEKLSLHVFKCNICGSVQFSAKHLRRHQTRHSRCKFCKLQFKSIGMKQQHIIYSCLVKEALNSMPKVEVERVELNKNVRLRYQDTFTSFPPFPGMEKINSTTESTNSAEEIIEIISDDERTLVSPTRPICSRNKTPTTSAVTTTFHENLTPTVIKPDVRIKNDNVLDSIKTQDSELGVIKELLTKYRELQSVAEATQTELPTTELIEVNEEQFTAELKKLKQVLYTYQIPVKILKGAINASYNYQSTPPKSKNLSLWNDLTPIDFENRESSFSDQIPNSEHVIKDIPVTHSNNTTNDIDSIHKSKSYHSLNNNHSSLQNVGIVTSASSTRSKTFSDTSQTKHPIIFTRTASLVPTPECFTVAQAGSPTTSTQSSNKKIKNGNPTSFELCPVQTPIGDIPIRRQSPNSFRTDQINPRNNSHSLEVFPVQSTCLIANTHNGRNSSSADETVSQGSASINSESFRKSPVQNKSDVNANRKSLNSQSEAMDCSVITRQDLTNKAIEYVFYNSGDTSAINVRPSNGLIYSNNTQQRRTRQPLMQKSNIHRNFSKETANYLNISFPVITNSSSDSHKLRGNTGPNQRVVLNENNVLIKPPPPYPRGSTPVNQTSQSYILSHNNSSNLDQTDETRQTSGYYSAYHQYVAQRQEFRSPRGRAVSTYNRKAVLDAVTHCGKIGYFPASNLLRKSIGNHSVSRSPKMSEPSFCHVIESSVTFPHYSKTNNYVNTTSVIVNPVARNCDVSNTQLPITCTNSSTPAACDTLAEGSIPSSDRNKHFSSGLIRVRNVCELT